MAPLFFVSVLNVASVPLFYRYLGAEMYAIWFYVQTLTGSFGFTDLGLGVAVGRFMGVALGRGDRDAVKSYWGTANATACPLLLLMASIFIIVGIAFGPKWFNVSSLNERLLQWCFVAGGVALALSYYNQFWNVLSQAHLDFKFISLARIAIIVLQIVPAIVLARFTGNPFILIVWGIFVALIQLSIFVIHARRKYDIGVELSTASVGRLKEMGGYISKAFATIVINSLFGSIDRLVAGKLAAAPDFTQYSIASNLGARLSGFSLAAAGPVFNNTSRIVSESPTRAAASIFNEAFNFLVDWYCLAVIWVAVWHDPLAKVWLGSQTGAGLSPLLPPLLLAYSLSALAIISSAQLGALNRVGLQALFALTSGLLTIPAVFFGWKIGGLNGLAWGFLASRITLVAQDIVLIRLIGAGGWLSRRTWLVVGSQTLFACLFIPLRRFAQNSIPLSLSFAVLHGLLVSLWLLHRQFGFHSRFRAEASS